jgi:hypothetical protein
MSFDTRNGTRGARQPKAGVLMRFMNKTAMNRIRRKGGRIMGFNALVLTTATSVTQCSRTRCRRP